MATKLAKTSVTGSVEPIPASEILLADVLDASGYHMFDRQLLAKIGLVEKDRGIKIRTLLDLADFMATEDGDISDFTPKSNPGVFPISASDSDWIMDALLHHPNLKKKHPLKKGWAPDATDPYNGMAALTREKKAETKVTFGEDLKIVLPEVDKPKIVLPKKVSLVDQAKAFWKSLE